MKGFASNVNRLLDAIGKICEVFCSVIALAMVTLVTVQVILRMLNMPLFGIEELLNFPTIWIYFIGGACAAYTNAHIECGIIKAISKNQKKILIAELVSSILASGLAIYVLKWGYEYSSYCLQINQKSPVLGIPMPLGELFIMIGLTLMALYTVVKLIKILVTFKTVWKGGE